MVEETNTDNREHIGYSPGFSKAENTPPATYYEPGEISGMETAEELDSTIAKLTHDMADVNHPLSPVRQSISPQKKALTAYRMSLYERRAELKADEPDIYTKMIEEQEAKNEADHKKLVDEAERLLVEAETLGLERTYPKPSEITPEIIKIQRIQNASVRGDTATMSSLMFEVMRDLNQSPGQVRGFGTLMDNSDDLDTGLRQELTLSILKHFKKLYQEKRGKK